MKTYGTLEFIQDEKKRDKIIVKGFQPTVLISRIVPKSWNYERRAVEIDANILNVRNLDMIMYKYPLEIKQPEKWKHYLSLVADNDAIAEKLSKLEHREPDESIFKGKLRDFQKEGLDFLFKTGGNALLADEMGLGKTVQTLAFIASNKDALPVLIVSPLVTLRNWQNEIRRFINTEQKGTLFDGELGEPSVAMIRSGKNADLPNLDFYIINYELLHKRVDDIMKINPRTLVCDEVQNLRSLESNKFKAVRELADHPSIRYRLGLSGTPIYNKGSEIWGIVDILQKGLLGSYSDFIQTFCHDWSWKVMADKQQALAEILREHVMIRRKKSEVLKDLPEKNRYYQHIQVDEEYYNAEIEKMFKKIDQAKDSINQASGNEEKKERIFELSKSYRQSIQAERQVAGIAKAPYVVDYIKDLMELDEKIVVYVHHIAVHDILFRGLYEFNPLRIIGGQKDTVRFDSIDLFQNDDSRRLIICALRAGNVGITITAGNYVIFGELDWSPPVHRQAEDRLHRIGQHKPVFAHYLIGDNTMDEHVQNILT